MHPSDPRYVSTPFRREGSRGVMARFARMSEESADSRLGALRGTYRTDNRRRGWIAAILLLACVPVTDVGVHLVMIVDELSDRKNAGNPFLLPGVTTGLGIGMLLVGTWLGILVLTHRGEVFELHDNGLRYARASRSQSITWADVDRVVVKSVKNHPVSRWASGDITCTIHLVGGGKLTITGLTRDAWRLIRHVETAAKPRSAQ